MRLNSAQIIDFSKIYKEDLDIVGKKAVELGELIRLGIPIPNGFVITTSFFKKLLEQTGIAKEILEIQKISHPAIQDSMPRLFEPIKKKIMHTRLPQDLLLELHNFYKKLSGLFRESSLNIFTSPLKGKSIQFLDIKGDANFILKIKEIWALQLHNPVAIIVQKNIQSKIKGKITTNDPLIDKKFADFAKKIQRHFYFPQEVDYVIEKNKIYITQVKSFTGTVDNSSKQTAQIRRTQKILIKGISVNPGIVTGTVKLINNQNYVTVKNSEIIVTKSLDKALCNKIKKAKAVVTDTILQTSIDKFHYRKIIKVPTIIGCGNATKILQNGNIVTVNGMSGEIYSGGFT